MFKIFPRNYLHLFTKLSLEIAVFAILITLSMSVYGQRTLGKISLLNPSDPGKTLLAAAADIDQCANGQASSPESCDGSNWVNGNVNQSKAHWAETESLVYRMKMTGLSIGPSHTLIVGYDILKGTAHAIDYLTSYDRTETTGAAAGTHANQSNPCSGFPCTTGSPTSTFLIPQDTVTVIGQVNADNGTPLTQIPGNFTMWNGTITNVSYVTYGGGEERQVAITFTAASANVLLAWGGHVAWQGEWGRGLSAGAISGSPYHMRLIDLDGSGGNQDRSLSADAVAIPAKFTLVKLVPFALSASPTVSFSFSPTLLNFAGFTFNPTASCPNVCLSPLTVNASQSTASVVFPAMTTNLSGLAADARKVQESTTPPSGWKVTGVGCFNARTNSTANTSTAGTNISAGIAIATITPQEGDDIQCTFTNSVVTAAHATITGRVTTASGNGISGAVITANDVNTGATVTVLTNPFGYYTLSNMPVNDFYVVSVSSKRYRFSNNTSSLTLNDDFAGLNFVADF